MAFFVARIGEVTDIQRTSVDVRFTRANSTGPGNTF
jgi:hypothetical protein